MRDIAIYAQAEALWREAHQAADRQRQLARLTGSKEGALSGLRELIRRVALLNSARRAASGEGMPNQT